MDMPISAADRFLHLKEVIVNSKVCDNLVGFYLPSYTSSHPGCPVAQIEPFQATNSDCSVPWPDSEQRSMRTPIVTNGFNFTAPNDLTVH